MGDVNKLMNSHNVEIRRGEKSLHRSQGIVERFNRTLEERLFGHQYAQEILMKDRGKHTRSSEWVQRLPQVIKAISDEPTRLIGMKPCEAIKKTSIKVESSALTKNKNEERLSYVFVRYLYQPGELEGGDQRRATDLIWSLDIYKIKRSAIKPDQPIVYYLNGIKRGYVHEELLVVPPNSELPLEKKYFSVYNG